MLIQLYILRQLLISVGFSLAGIGLIVLPTIAIQAINRLGALSLTAVLSYLPLVIAELVPYLLPMAFLLGVVATYGRLSAEREWIAIQMAGINPARLALPGFLLALPLALGTDRLLAEISPAWKYLQRTYLRNAEVDIFRNLAKGRTDFQFGRISLLAQDRHDSVLKGVLLDLPGEDGRELTVVADECLFEIGEETVSLQLERAQFLTENARASLGSPSYTRKLGELFPIQPKDRSKPKYLTSTELRDELAGTRLKTEERQEFLFEIHRRHALSMTYLLFLLLGIPTGVVLRSSTQLGAFTGAVGYAFLYYVLALRLGKVLAETGSVPPLAAAWATNALFLVVGAVFFVRALWR